MRKLALTLGFWLFWFASPPARAHDDAASAYQKAMQEYVQNASFLIRNNIDWRLVTPSHGEAQALVVIRFNPDGSFMTAKIEERSGNLRFDIALESAVRRSIPTLGRPPLAQGATAPLSIPMRFRVVR